MMVLSVKAQNVIVVGSIDRDSISVGQPFNYELSMKIQKDYFVEWINLEDTLSSEIELINKGDVVKTAINDDKDLLLKQQLTLTSFDTGYVVVPEIGLTYTQSEGDSLKFVLYTDPLELYVKSVAVDTTMAFKPIKGPIRQSITAREVFPWAAAIIVLAAIVFLIIYLRKRFKKKEHPDEEEKKPLIPAIITARERMGQLKEMNLWQSGKLKEYYTDLTDIAREYLEGQFDIDAVEMTSEDILVEVKKIGLEDCLYKKLKETLITADFVKFAKANPTPSQNETSYNDISSFIEDSYVHYQEVEKQKAEEEKAKKLIRQDVDNKGEDINTEKQETEDTK